jgi:hypothetical protein
MSEGLSIRGRPDETAAAPSTIGLPLNAAARDVRMAAPTCVRWTKSVLLSIVYFKWQEFFTKKTDFLHVVTTPSGRDGDVGVHEDDPMERTGWAEHHGTS